MAETKHPDRILADKAWEAAVTEDQLAAIHESEGKTYSSSLLYHAYHKAASVERELAAALRIRAGMLHERARKAGG